MNQSEAQKATRIAAASLFCLLMAVYMLRAVRDEMALLSGIPQLGQLFSGGFLLICFLALLLSLFKNSISAMWCLSLLCLALLSSWQIPTISGPALQAISFMLLSAVGLLLISQFWAVLLTRFNRHAARKHYPFIITLGGLGALSGPLLVTKMAAHGPYPMFLIAVSLLMICCCLLQSIRPVNLAKEYKTEIRNRSQSRPSRLAAMIFIYSIMGTLVYAEQLDVLAATELTQVERLGFYGKRDGWIGLFTLLLHWFSLKVKSNLIQWTGFQWMPLLTWVLLLLVGLNGSLEAVLWSMIIFRSVNYACIRPARETYYFELRTGTRLKPFIDTVTYRGGDLAGIWLFQWWQQANLSYTALAVSLLPLILIWFLLNQKIVKSLKLHHE